MDIKNKNVFCSWSGGKDSCLSLYRAIKEGGKIKYIFTMFTEGRERSRSHGLMKQIIEEQAKSIGASLVVEYASWDDYEQKFINILKEFENDNVEIGLFGDIDIEEHKAWVVKTCDYTTIKPYHPIWKEGRKDLLLELIDLGFEAKIVALKDEVLGKEYLGRTLDKELVEEFEKLGIDPCGEEGEFHTLVTNGPIFSYPIKIKEKDIVLSKGYWFLDVALEK